MAFLNDAWYVAAFADEITGEPQPRRLLDEAVVLYRGAQGQAVALADRCPHRFAPLSRGRVVGDSLECGYHGLRFAPSGACVHNPHGDCKIPAAAKVRHFPVLERDGLVWVWMGDAARADPALALDLAPILNPARQSIVRGKLRVKAHYQIIVDNLLDLGHVPYLHPQTLGNEESRGRSRNLMEQQGDRVWSYHWTDASPPSPTFAPFRRSTAPLVNLRAHICWQAPANLTLEVGLTELDAVGDEGGLFGHMAHLLTPLSEHETEYYWLAGRNYAVGVETVDRITETMIRRAFEDEDEPMIEAIAQNMTSTDLLSLAPVSLPSDAAGLRARRLLAGLIKKEGSAATADLG
jgi:vanillate O-demethylase monooxygenase subunit